MRYPLLAVRALLASGALVAITHDGALPPPAGDSVPALERARQPTPAQLRWARNNAGPAVTIDKCEVELNGTTTDIGDIDATLTHGAGSSVMRAEFKLDKKFKDVTKWTGFHWVQKITADDCPAKYEGKALPFPHVDPPKGGWDYMYHDGATRKKPNNSIPNYGWFIDGDPWYYNATGEKAQNTIGSSYKINDVPTHCAAKGVTKFETWLVASTGKSICLIAGFSWAISSDAAKQAGPTDLGKPDANDVKCVGDALTNGKIAGWTVGAPCKIKCPLPGSGKVPPKKAGAVTIPKAFVNPAGWSSVQQIHMVPGPAPGLWEVALTVTGLAPSLGGRGSGDFLTGTYDVARDQFRPNLFAAGFNTAGYEFGLTFLHDGLLAVGERLRGGGVHLGNRTQRNQAFNVRGPVRGLPPSGYYDPSLGLIQGDLYLFTALTGPKHIVGFPLDPLQPAVFGQPLPVIQAARPNGEPNSPTPITDSRGEVLGFSHHESLGNDNDHFIAMDLDIDTPSVLFIDTPNWINNGGFANGSFFDAEFVTPPRVIRQDAFWCTPGQANIGNNAEISVLSPIFDPTSFFSVAFIGLGYLDPPIPLPPLGDLGINIGPLHFALSIGPHVGGRATQILPIPPAPGLSGLSLALQALVLNPRNPANSHLTNTASIRIH